MNKARLQKSAPKAQLFVARNARDTDARAVVEILLTEHHLEVAFDPAQFVVVEAAGKVVACARLKPLGERVWEIASVAVLPAERRRGYGARAARFALDRAQGTIYALALARPFFEALGFRAIERVPDALVGKATSVCASSGFVPMSLERD